MAVDAETIRATFYFTPAQLRELEIVMLRCRVDHGREVTKSQIMRIALDFIIENYKCLGPNSQVIQDWDRHFKGEGP